MSIDGPGYYPPPSPSSATTPSSYASAPSPYATTPSHPSTSPNSGPGLSLERNYRLDQLDRSLHEEQLAVSAGDTTSAKLAATDALNQVPGAGLAPEYGDRIRHDIINPNPSTLRADRAFVDAIDTPASVLSPSTPLINASTAANTANAGPALPPASMYQPQTPPTPPSPYTIPPQTAPGNYYPPPPSSQLPPVPPAGSRYGTPSQVATSGYYGPQGPVNPTPSGLYTGNLGTPVSAF